MPRRHADALAALETHGAAFMRALESDSDADATVCRRARREAKAAKQAAAAAAGSAAAAPPPAPPLPPRPVAPPPPRHTLKKGAAAAAAPAPAPPPKLKPVVVVAAPPAAAPLPPPSSSSLADRKRFMSASTAHVFAERDPALRGSAAAAGAAAHAPASSLPPAPDLRALAREVEDLGVTGLDKRAAAALEARRLAEAGCRAAPKPSVPAPIGLRQAAYQRARAARELEAAIDAGLVSRRGLGKKKRRERERGREDGRDGGLGELASFKGGVLRRTPSKTPTRPPAPLGPTPTRGTPAARGAKKPARRVSFGRAVVLRSPAAVLHKAAPASLTPAKGGRRAGGGEASPGQSTPRSRSATKSPRPPTPLRRPPTPPAAAATASRLAFLRLAAAAARKRARERGGGVAGLVAAVGAAVGAARQALWAG